MEANLWICIGLTLFGVLFHFMLKLGELETQGKIITPLAYWAQHPYTSVTMLMAAVMAMVAQYEMGQMSYVGSLAIGIACNSIADKARAKAATYTDKLP